ncbi:unnamed protein product [Darwinula stevensoni]|uniref:Uncharacterized protein n=1 Tax=Darwinula stevensoni TaxID=69355 RepID=A0A7R8X4I6_9CRUS|nr:unnamed protein product [Darwinula stevensoni]CAG0883562.1 unnamed protein product [Darwinula stevensoni]
MLYDRLARDFGCVQLILAARNCAHVSRVFVTRSSLGKRASTRVVADSRGPGTKDPTEADVEIPRKTSIPLSYRGSTSRSGCHVVPAPRKSDSVFPSNVPLEGASRCASRRHPGRCRRSHGVPSGYMGTNPPRPPSLSVIDGRQNLEPPLPRIDMDRVSLSVVFALALVNQAFAFPFGFSLRTKRERPSVPWMLPGVMLNAEGGRKAKGIASEESFALERERSNANDYVDQLLDNVQNFIIENGYDNFPLPDQIEEFSEVFLGIEWHGEASLTQGFLKGLETVHRTGDATLDTSGNTITVTADIGFHAMEGGYHMHVDFMDIGIDVDAAVHIQDVAAHFKVPCPECRIFLSTPLTLVSRLRLTI